MNQSSAAPGNLTEQQKLVVPARGLDPVPGHRLVVFKKVGVGRKLRACLEPEQRLKRTILEPPSSFVAYAVPCDKQLRYQFERTFKSHDQLHSFSLLLTFEYRIAEPASLVEALGKDPLRSLGKETVSVLKTTLKRLDWHLIEREPVDLEKVLFLDPVDGETNLERLRRFAASYGIGLGRITASRQLPDNEIQVGRAAREHSERQEILTIEHGTAGLKQAFRHELQDREDGFDRRKEILDTVAHEASRAIGRAAERVRTFSDIQSAVRQVQGMRNDLLQLGAGGGPSQAGALPPSQQIPAGGATVEAATPVGSLLGEISRNLSHLPREAPQRNLLLSALLHLIGEALLGDGADQQVVTRYTDRTRELFESLLPSLSAEQIRLVRRVLDVDRLRGELT